MRTLKSIYRSTLAIAIVYCLIALIGGWVFCSFDVFLGIIGMGISVLLLITALQQNQIQKDNIKLQMFDKRFAVYEAIVDSRAVAERKDYSDYILSGNTDPFTINKLISDVNANLQKQTLLSQALFDNSVYQKVKAICSRFDQITKLHFISLKQNLRLQESDPMQLEAFGALFAKTAMATSSEELKQCDTELMEHFPDIYKTIVDFNEAVAAYSSFIETNGIMGDFDAYLMLDKLDK